MVRRKNRWFFQQMRREQPGVQERRWAYQSRKSLYGAVRVSMLDGSKRVFRSMPTFMLSSLIVRNAAGKIRVLFSEQYVENPS